VQHPYTCRSDLDLLFVQFARWHKVRLTHARARTDTLTVALLWKSDQLVTEATTYTTHTNPTHKHPYPYMYSNPWPQQTSSVNLRLRSLNHRDRLYVQLDTPKWQHTLYKPHDWRGKYVGLNTQKLQGHSLQLIFQIKPASWILWCDVLEKELIHFVHIFFQQQFKICCLKFLNIPLPIIKNNRKC